jgi:hypothetical protein
MFFPAGFTLFWLGLAFYFFIYLLLGVGVLFFFSLADEAQKGLGFVPKPQGETGGWMFR